MPYVPKTGDETFDSGWQKTQAWAQSQGISINSILPVYQMDLSRIQNGGYPMGTAERNLAVAAAHNPNQVSSAPQDNPKPSNVIGNAVSDAGKIATGLAGIFTGSFEKQVYDSAKATIHGFADPKSLEASTLGGTIENWLNNTLLSFVPGATDVASVLHGGPAQLLDHPLVSLLDVMPDIGGAGSLTVRLAGRYGSEEAAARVAALRIPGAATGLKAAGRKIGQSELGGILGGGTIVEGGKTVAVDRFSVRQKLDNIAARLGPGGSGVGKQIGDLSETVSAVSAMGPQEADWLLAPIQAELKGLRPEEALRINQVLYGNAESRGDLYKAALADPSFSPVAKQVMKDTMNGPIRFSVESSILRGGLKPTRTMSGDIVMYAASGPGARVVRRVEDKAQRARAGALKRIEELAPQAEQVAALDVMRTNAIGALGTVLTRARQHVFNDPKLSRPGLTQDIIEGKKTRTLKLSRIDQVHAVVDQGGVADQFFEQIKKSSDPVIIRELARAMKERLRAWGPKSVDASENPALMALYNSADAFEHWADHYLRVRDEIDAQIHGTVKAEKHFYTEQQEYRGRGLTELRQRHREERHNLEESRRQAKAKRDGAVALKIREAKEAKVWFAESVEREAESRAGRATSTVLDTQIMPLVRRRISAFNTGINDSIKRIKRDHAAATKLAWTEYQRDSSRMVRRHSESEIAAKKLIAGEKAGMGETLAEMVRYGDAIREVNKAVMDHPSDAYRDVFVALIEKNLKENEATAALTIATDKWLKDRPDITAKRLAQIRADPQYMRELMMAKFHEIVQADQDPEIAEAATAEMELYRKDADEELKLLIGQGLKVPYIPTVTSFDESLGRNSMAPNIGHGIPKPSMEKAKVWDLTPRKEDFALGATKAVIETLQRDATIYLVEHHLTPMAMTQTQVDDFLMVFRKPERRLRGGDTLHETQALTHEDLNLVKFDPQGLFGFTMPRWSKAENLYLPRHVVNALSEFEKTRRRNLLKLSNKVFRYSILGLSPRYTAHIVFGGTMMLAMRSSPHAIPMIFKVSKALRDGTIPHEALGGRETELGYESPIKMFQRQQGHDMGHMEIGEHIEKIQGIKAAAAKPVHILKAMADLNWRFTNHVRHMQLGVAYLDAAAQVTRREGRIEIEDPATGKMISVTSERAVKEGIHHVQQVYGNLNRMSPFERQVAQTVVPFYGWQKHILGYVMTFPFDHPWRAMVLSQLAYNSSNDIPLAYPIRLQLLMFLGSPDAEGNVTAIDMRSLDPFRDVANYATWTGFFESLNPALAAPLVGAFGSQATYGSSSLYPGVSYNAFYGIQTASSGGSWINMLEQWVPQAGAVQSAAQAAGGLRSEWKTNPTAATTSLLESLNIPFLTPPRNLKQIAAKDQNARFESAKAAATAAFQSGDFSGLGGYKTVPNPLNDAYEITPAQLEELYTQAQQANPGVAPIESLLPPPTPYGW